MRDTVERISIPLVGDGNNSQTQRAVQTLRNAVIPQTIGAVFGTAVAVSGMTAGSSDFNNTSHVPLVFGLVLALVFLVMLVTFRSIMIPAKAVLLNLLSVLERLLVGQMAGRHHLVAAPQLIAIVDTGHSPRRRVRRSLRRLAG